MSKKMCLDCGRVSDQSRCPIHRTKQARGYGTEHQNFRKLALKAAPYCWMCRHGVNRETGRCGRINCPQCPLQLHHVSELRGGRSVETDDRRQLLCIRCHNSVKEK